VKSSRLSIALGLLAIALFPPSALCLCTAAYATPKYRALHNFTGTDGDGSAGVTVDHSGNVYGTSLGGGGSKNCGPGGCGVAFELTPGKGGTWVFTTLYSFTAGRDGASPNSPLILDASGNLYGTTNSGGAHGGGTVFELTPGDGGWALTALYSFCNQEGCVGLPQAGVAMDQAGNLYGTTPELPSGGAAYRIANVSGEWQETALHAFCVSPLCADGARPYAGLILDASGNLYGTTEFGGNSCGSSSCGTVYELSPLAEGGWKETVLFRFDSYDGAWPSPGALLMDGSGALYGTTINGGTYGGVVFKLTPKGDGHWKETTVYDFQGGAKGWLPGAGVVMDKSGNLYGTTDGGGGPNGCGVIYKLAPVGKDKWKKDKWKYTVLHTFGKGHDGCVPAGNLALDDKGNLYGGTVLGGSNGYGVVYELTP
jgi:uncharacterized repeat protein (TIGR03803 family)